MTTAAMRIIDCVQGSPEWIQARLGVPTASNADRILTPGGKLSASSDKYLAQLVAEWFMGVSLDDGKSAYMERGTELEAEAVRYYEFQNDCLVKRVGLCLRDDGKVGGSPDGFVGDDGGLEIKCPSPAVHMGLVLSVIGTEYRGQAQWNLWLTGRKWWDILCYHPTLPRVRVRMERDEPFIALLEPAVDAFVARLDAAKERLADEKAAYDANMAEITASGDHSF